jgi:hypothetical protein
VDRERDRSGVAGGREHVGAEAARGVHDQLTLVEPTELGEPGHERRQRVVGDGEQHELGPLDDLLDLEHRHPRQQVGDAVTTGLGDPAGADDGVPGAPEDVREHGADPTRSDDADPQPTRPRGHRALSRPGVVGSTPA